MEVVMFPGQGSQQLGMGREVFEKYPELCARASEVVGYSITELCLTDPGDRLGQTAYQQQAIYFVSCLLYREHVARVGEERVGCVLGHSLGLYPALYAAGVFDLLGGLEIVTTRGRLMQAVEGGAMLAVIGSHVDQIDEQLARLDAQDVDIANYNSPDQVVLSATRRRVDELAPRLQEAGYRCVPLSVSGAFHSRHMEPCLREFARFLLDREFAAPVRTVVSTTTGQVVGAEHLLEEMVYQLVRPVRWWQTVRHLAGAGHTTFHEVGPGTVLTRLNETILRGEESRLMEVSAQ